MVVVTRPIYKSCILRPVKAKRLWIMCLPIRRLADEYDFLPSRAITWKRPSMPEVRISHMNRIWFICWSRRPSYASKNV